MCTTLAGPAWACADLPSTDAAALSLLQAQARVADCHPDVRAARAALGAAFADVQIAGQLPNPQLTVGAGSVGTRLGSGPWWRKTYDQSVRLDQLLERGNKPALRRAVADATRLAVRADLADAQRRAASAVAHAHQDLWALQGRQAQLQADVRVAWNSIAAQYSGKRRVIYGRSLGTGLAARHRCINKLQTSGPGRCIQLACHVG